MNNKVTIVKPTDKTKTIFFGGMELHYFATGKETNGQYCLVEAVISPGAGAPPHIHSREEELDYILEGEMTYWLENEKVTAPKGTYINIPLGIKHSLLNQTNEEVRVLFLSSPAGFEDLLDELAENEKMSARPEETIAALNEIGKKYGLTVFEE